MHFSSVNLDKRVFGEARWVLLGQIGTGLGSLVGLKLLTQLLPKEIFGRVNLLEVALVLPGWLFFSPILQSAIRLYAPSREEGHLRFLLRTTVSLYFGVSVLVVVGGLALITSGLLQGTRFSPLALTLTLAIFVSSTWQLLGLGLAGAARLRKRSAALSVFTTWGRPLGAAAAVILFGPSLAAVLGGYLAASLITLPLALKSVRVAFDGKAGPWLHPGILNKLLAYGTPYALWSAFAWGENYAERYVLQFLLGAAAVGPYAAAAQVAALPFGFGSAFLLQLATPIVFERAGTGIEPARLASGRSVVQSSFKFFIGLGLLLVLGYALAGGWIMRLLTQVEYLVPRRVLVILAAGAFMQNLAQLLSMSVLAQNRTGALLWSMVIPGTLSIPLSLLWVRQAGMLGAALANAATSFLFLALVWWSLRTLVPKSRSSREPLI